MEIDGNFGDLIEFLEESIRIKTCLIALLNFILDIFDGFTNFNLLDERSFCNYVESHIRSTLMQIENFKIFEEEFDVFLSNNLIIFEFLKKNKLDPSIIKTHLKFQYEFIDNLKDQGILELEKIYDLREDVEKLKSERAYINRTIDTLKNELKSREKCFICYNKGNDRIGSHICEKCKRHICSNHLFAGKMCEICAKRYIEDKES